MSEVGEQGVYRYKEPYGTTAPIGRKQFTNEYAANYRGSARQFAHPVGMTSSRARPSIEPDSLFLLRPVQSIHGVNDIYSCGE
jgi:hypothetical protein